MVQERAGLAKPQATKTQSQPTHSETQYSNDIDINDLPTYLKLRKEPPYDPRVARAIIRLQSAVGNSAASNLIRRFTKDRGISKKIGQIQSAEKLTTEISQRRYTIQRYRERTAVNNMGSGIDPSTVTISSTYATVEANAPASIPSPSLLNFGGSRVENVTLGEGTRAGRVRMNIYESANINNLIFDEIQWGSWDGTVPFTVRNNQVTFGAPIVDSDSGGSGATLSVNMANSSWNGGGYVTFTLTVASSGSVSTGGGIGVGPISGSAPVSSSSSFAGGISRSFTVNLRITPPQPITAPDVSFQVGSARLEDGQEGAIASWFRTLSTTVKDDIRNGRRSISISGYASRTGRRRNNRDLSEQRANVVKRILRGFAGSNANINIFYFGEDNATTPDEREDPRWRRATIVVQTPTTTGPQMPGPAPSP